MARSEAGTSIDIATRRNIKDIDKMATRIKSRQDTNPYAIERTTTTELQGNLLVLTSQVVLSNAVGPVIEAYFQRADGMGRALIDSPLALYPLIEHVLWVDPIPPEEPFSISNPNYTFKLLLLPYYQGRKITLSLYCANTLLSEEIREI